MRADGPRTAEAPDRGKTRQHNPSLLARGTHPTIVPVTPDEIGTLVLFRFVLRDQVRRLPIKCTKPSA
jgi:hypothetical protein